jgi:hypothetical protein
LLRPVYILAGLVIVSHGIANSIDNYENIKGEKAGDTIAYFYNDDFITDKVINDSYFHSSIYYYAGPPISFNGYLVLWPIPGSYDIINFHKGWDPGTSASLDYSFPLSNIPGYIIGGEVSFSTNIYFKNNSSSLRVTVVYDNGDQEQLGVFGQGEEVQYSLSPPDSVLKCELRFFGEDIWLDYIAIDLIIIETDIICGDANSDGQIDVGDAVFLINHIFKGGPAPYSLEAGDANCDGEINVGDPVYLINYIFKAGPEPGCP